MFALVFSHESARTGSYHASDALVQSYFVSFMCEHKATTAEKTVLTLLKSAKAALTKHSDIGQLSATNMLPMQIVYIAPKQSNILSPAVRFMCECLPSDPEQYVVRSKASSCEPGLRVKELVVNSISSSDSDVRSIVQFKKKWHRDSYFGIFAALPVTAIISRVSGTRQSVIYNLQLYPNRDGRRL